MTTTTHLGITLVEQSQAQKEVTVNAAFTRIDAVLNSGAKSRTITIPPGSPANGDLYIVATSSTGAWAGQDKNLAYYDQIWRFITPNEGISLWVNDEDLPYTYNGTSWVSSTFGGTLAIANGGTGQTTANAALNALLPNQTSNSGKVLSTDGTNASWTSAGGAGTVTSVSLTMPAEFSVSGSPITASGTLAVSKANQSANVFYGGPASGSAAAPTFRALNIADLPTRDLVYYTLFGGL